MSAGLRFFFVLALWATLCISRKPNIILMLAGDFGYESIGVNSYATPELDLIKM